MKTFKRICLKDFTVTGTNGRACTIRRGKEYITSEVNESSSIGPEPIIGYVVVFTNYWIHAPIEIFGGTILFTEGSE
jgi:hypothetical protein